MAEEEKVEEKKKHEKAVYVYPDGTTLVYYQQNLNKCTDVVVGFRIPRVDLPYENEIIGTWKNKLVFYQDTKEGLIRVPLVKPGLPHFVEHMIYSSLPGLSKESLHDYFIKTNTHHNAFTSKDTLAATFNCPSKFNDVVFSLYSQMLFRKKYNKADLKSEREPVFQELKLYADYSKDAVIDEDYIIDVLISNYDSVPLVDLLGIDRKIIDSFNEREMVRFTDAYFTRQNMVISVVSDRPFEEIKELCEKNFVLPAKSNEATTIRTPKPIYLFNDDDMYLFQNKKMETANVIFALRGTNNHEENEIYSTVEDFLLNHFNGRLMKTLRDEKGLVYTPAFGDANLPGLSLKFFQARTTKKNVNALINSMVEILSELADKGITDAEYVSTNVGKQTWKSNVCQT